MNMKRTSVNSSKHFDYIKKIFLKRKLILLFNQIFYYETKF